MRVYPLQNKKEGRRNKERMQCGIILIQIYTHTSMMMRRMIQQEERKQSAVSDGES
jgi:hypothetical protein